MLCPCPCPCSNPARSQSHPVQPIKPISHDMRLRINPRRRGKNRKGRQKTPWASRIVSHPIHPSIPSIHSVNHYYIVAVVHSISSLGDCSRVRQLHLSSLLSSAGSLICSCLFVRRAVAVAGKFREHHCRLAADLSSRVTCHWPSGDQTHAHGCAEHKSFTTPVIP